MIESITINNVVEIEHLNELVEKLQKPENAADIINNTKKFFKKKGKVSYLLLVIRAKFPLQGEGKVYTDGQQTQDS